MLTTTEVGAVVFELDGVLVDTAADVRLAAEEMLADLSLPSLNSEHVSDWLGDGYDKLIHRILSRRIDGYAPEPIFRLGSALFLKAYQRRNHKRSVLYAGVESALRQLSRRKVPMVLLTNQTTSLANELLTQFGIRNHFSLVLGRDALQEQKPSPDGLLESALLLHLNPEQLLMVGGNVNDVNAARSAGSQVVCVSYGYNYGTDIRRAAPDQIIDSLNELPLLLKQENVQPTRKRYRRAFNQSLREKR